MLHEHRAYKLLSIFSIISYSLDTTEQKQGKSHVHMEVHDLDEFVAN